MITGLVLGGGHAAATEDGFRGRTAHCRRACSKAKGSSSVTSPSKFPALRNGHLIDYLDQEALRGNLAGLHSIRINDQWRVVFPVGARRSG
jgi:hypothetical protein